MCVNLATSAVCAEPNLQTRLPLPLMRQGKRITEPPCAHSHHLRVQLQQSHQQSETPPER